MNLDQDRKNILRWYKKNARNLPWRNTQDPYKVWISEIMLQQTTTESVKPYFENFIKRFPNLKSLSQAPLGELLKYWSGLGYYRRAHHLHKTSRILKKKNKFPRSYKELLELPGIGPYTSRAISSLCFKEKVGVVDGNVIRVLSRKHGLKLRWWERKNLKKFQDLADQYVQKVSSDLMNSALMELGASLCSPTQPQCLLCPWVKSCKARKERIVHQLPLKKPRKKLSILRWNVEIYTQNKKLAFIENKKLPFLKGHLIFPGILRTLKIKPKECDFIHHISSYVIYVKIKKLKQLKKDQKIYWITQKTVNKKSPSSLIQKVIEKIN